MRRGWKGASIALVAAVAIGAGCSSSTESGNASSTTAGGSGTSAPSSSTTTSGGSTGSTAGDAAGSADDALIAASDLGSGWTRDVTAGGPPRSISETFLAVPACVDLVPDAGAGAATTSAAQASYSISGENIQVQYEVDVYPTEADAEAMIELFESSDFSSCLDATLATEVGAGTTVSGVTASSLDIASADDLGVDAAVGVAGIGAMAESGSTVSFQTHVVLLRKGNALGAFTVTLVTPGNQVTTSLQANDQAIEAAAEKLTAFSS
jgi:hypothetical protein